MIIARQVLAKFIWPRILKAITSFGAVLVKITLVHANLIHLHPGNIIIIGSNKPENI
jgi:hypothetical protein